MSSSTVFSPHGHVAMSSDHQWIHYLTESSGILVGFEGDTSDCQTLLTKLRAQANAHEVVSFSFSTDKKIIKLTFLTPPMPQKTE